MRIGDREYLRKKEEMSAESAEAVKEKRKEQLGTTKRKQRKEMNEMPNTFLK
jgi:hypothetical protein